MSKLSRELMIEQLVVTCGVSRQQVIEYLKKCSFNDYQKLREATADRNPWLTTGTNGNNVATQQASDTGAKGSNQKPYQSNIDQIGDELEDKKVSPDDGKFGVNRRDGGVYRIENEFGNEYEVTDTDGNRKRVRKQDVEYYDRGDKTSTYSKIKSLFMAIPNDRSFQKGAAFARQYMEDLEIERLQELAGITEVSVIGNTADSHKPTVQLRKKERIKRDQRDRKRENKGYTPEKRVKRDINVSVAANIRRDLK